MSDYQRYSELLQAKELKFNLRWYDSFGSVEVKNFSEDKKFQEVVVSDLDSQDIYDIVFNDISLIYVVEGIEDLMNELRQIQIEHFKNIGDNMERPLINGVLIVNPLISEFYRI